MENQKTETVFIFIWAIGTLFIIVGILGTFRIQHLKRKAIQDEFNKQMDSLDSIIKDNDKKIKLIDNSINQRQ